METTKGVEDSLEHASVDQPTHTQHSPQPDNKTNNQEGTTPPQAPTNAQTSNGEPAVQDGSGQPNNTNNEGESVSSSERDVLTVKV